ncbi:hypothetical protein [Clostridium felsineum]|uniref:Uncharacterized protein n=1 Tax=Clostridium felsineum TaxID=36839 RepID=A0A1S8KZ76_9CLOT|nr:hypothetical protein [Clostridium felsineum]MCR3761558.1 hypothetical protein [Clostridium felsineum]URZ07691.1 hypothetical protein CLROS_030520 [Clostridium felsineum]URZ12722.1 hypothetical protein CROST_034670 [Clostridium felsineum]URZ15370.1 hypothetical protein CLFE_013880 [Clostridium felsineum DSM 794]
MKKIVEALKNSVMMLGFFLDPELVRYANINEIVKNNYKDIDIKKVA